MAVLPTASADLAGAIERNRRRLWLVCYRMTGNRADADDLTQDAVARALERGGQIESADPTGWLLRTATTVCLDHLRRETVRRRVNQLTDTLDMPGLGPGEPRDDGDPERAAILREDVRFAVVVALQALTPRQRAAIVLRDICDRSIDEVAAVLGTNPNAAKAVLHRARAALATARHHADLDVAVDRAVVERMARAVEAGSIDELAALLADDVWGIVDGGDGDAVVQTAKKPTFGSRAVVRQFANARRKLAGAAIACEVRVLNGEPSLVLRLAAAPSVVTAVIHVETRAGRIAAVRTDRDPRRIAAFS